MSLDKVNETCIFINSCDNTHDVAEYFLRSFEKYIGNNMFDIFIGINKKKHLKKYNFLNYISVPKSNWQIETKMQLDELKKKYGYKNVIHILDDFIFYDHTDLKDLQNLIDLFNKKNLQYLCLKRMRECFLVNVINNLSLSGEISKIRENYPYYTSLQISLWNIDYFKKNIINTKSIWDFERLQLSKNHFHVNKDFFHYNHVVEKGEWNYGSLNYIEKYVTDFKPGNRKFRNSLFGFQIFYFKKIIFFIFGFLIMRLRNN